MILGSVDDAKREAGMFDQPLDQVVTECRGWCVEAARRGFVVKFEQYDRCFAQHLGGRSVARISIAGDLGDDRLPIGGLAEET